MDKRQFLIDEDLVLGLMQYLGTRPYQEVAAAMQRLASLQQVTTSEDAKKNSPSGLEKKESQGLEDVKQNH